MVKQLLLVITGEFNLTEFKNLVTDRTNWYNLQNKPVDTPDVRAKTNAEAEDKLAILLDGEESDVMAVAEIVKRGTLTGHVQSIHEEWRESKPEKRGGGRGPSRGAPQADGEGKPRRRRRRRRR